jgi:hypothetical protein
MAEGERGGVDEEWNILLVIMESVGARYVFDESLGSRMPMPNLKRLADAGLDLRRHHATSNSSGRSIFSIMTGLYPRPSNERFALPPGLAIPGIGSFLPEHTDRFVVTPGRLQSSFPMGSFIEQGFEEIYGYHTLPLESFRPSGAAGRHELDAADFFVSRLERAREPFFGIYYSYVPHFDYRDYGPEYRIVEDTDVRIHRYYNVLNLLDLQIGRMLEVLEQGEGMDRTLLVAMGIEHDLRRFQGWPLQRDVSLRSSIYLWGAEGTLSSIDSRERKLSLHLRSGACTAFDLIADPGEERPSPCSERPAAPIDNLLRFWMFQRDALDRHDRALKRDAGGGDALAWSARLSPRNS